MLNYKRNGYILKNPPKRPCNAESAIKALREIQRQSVLNGTSEMTLEEINAEIYLARREREFHEYTEKVWREMNETDRISLLNDNSELTLEEINAEIEIVRRELSQNDVTRNVFHIFREIAEENARKDLPLTFADFRKASEEARRAK